MAVGRHKESVNIIPENHIDFVRWLFLSVAIHLIPALVAALLPAPHKKVFYSPVYEVTLLTSPEFVKPQGAPKEEIKQKEEVTPHEEPKEEPKLKVEVKDIKHKAKIIRHKAIKKSRKEVVVPKPKDDAARPDEAVKKMREKIAAEDAVERMRKKVSEKETPSSDGIKIAAKAPAKVYHYEELDDEMKAYYAKIRQIIQDAWILPDVLRNKGYRTVIALKVLNDGTVQSLWILEKSGNNSYDETTVRATNKVTTLPPLPKAWKEGSIDFGFNF